MGGPISGVVAELISIATRGPRRRPPLACGVQQLFRTRERTGADEENEGM